MKSGPDMPTLKNEDGLWWLMADQLSSHPESA
jgi:hypothetical protein